MGVDFNIIDPKHSGFRKCHITETTLISLTDDIVLSFDTIKHYLLINRLQ